MPWFEFESRTFLWFHYYLSFVENHVCLSRGVYVTGATWRAAMMI
jgi:hypothetical protein